MEKIISIVISIYNEEAVLGKFFQAFDAMKETIQWRYELICVNDGSQDSSLKILQKEAEKNPSIKVISFSRNFGHEAAMIAGIDHANGTGIICMDADLQHPLECIPLIIENFEKGYEVINMVRMENKSAGLIKNITSKMFYKVINILSNQVEFEENASDFFAISRNVAEVLKNNYREKVRFLRGYVQSVGFNKTTINYIAAEREGGASHYNLKKLLKFSINTIVCFSDFPLKICNIAGFFSAVIGIVILIYSLLTHNGAPSGYSTIVVLNCFMFSILFLVIGIIGRYIAVLFAEVKDRPVYIIAKTINLEKNDEKV